MVKRWKTWAEYKAYVKRVMAFTIDVYAKRIIREEETLDGFPEVLTELIQERINELLKEMNEKAKAEAAAAEHGEDHHEA